MSEPVPSTPRQATESTGEEVDCTPCSPPLPERPSFDLPIQARPLPEVFGPYRIRELLGKGGMGAVYLAEDTRLGRKVALKIPRLDNQTSTGFLERFRREARIAATFHHPNLCPIYDVGEVDGIHYVTMPFLRGEPLSTLLRREHHLPPPRAVGLVILAARAMAVAHEAGVLHRDLKPSNIMVNDQGEPVVMDFGIAYQSTTGDPRLTGSLVRLGTPAYAAPEQITGPPHQLGPTCDVYSLGATLYEMLTGRLPWEGRLDQTPTPFGNSQPEPPSRFVTDLDPRLDAVCMRSLARDPAARFQSMAAFAEALAPLAAIHEADMAPPLQPAAPQSVHWPRRRVVALLIAFTLLVLAGLSAALLRIEKEQPRSEQAPGQPPDLFQAGSRWSGTYEWLPPLHGGGALLVTVAERNGNDFQGTYATREKDSRYEWRIAGTLLQNRVHCRFTEIIHEDKPSGVVENASVQGNLDGDSLELHYHDADSAARLHLRLEP